MANRFYSLNFGQKKTDVAETGSTTAGAAVELRITYDAANNNKVAVIAALEYIKQRLVEESWPPA